MARLDNAHGGKIKLGLDIHGVIDQAPEFFRMFSEMSNAQLDDIFEIHIITGIKEGLDDVVEFNYYKWFSIHQQCEDDGVEIKFDNEGRPWVDPNIWDRKKAEYCEREGIHMMIDDSPSYGKHFKDLECLYLRLENTKRDNWREDGQHAASPIDIDDRSFSFTVPGNVVRTARMIRRAFNWCRQSIKPLYTKVAVQIRAVRIQPSQLYEFDENVDKLVNHLIDNCELVKVSTHNAYFFDHKTTKKYEVWINNKMYGYATSGTGWSGANPSRVTTVRLYDMVEKHIIDTKAKNLI